MALLDFKFETDKHGELFAVDNKGTQSKPNISNYQPDSNTTAVRQLIVKHFRLGDMTMRRPRREFNDLSVLTRTMVDQMSFNAYQPNNGDALEGDEINSWRSRAMRPIARNKVISIAAHATARLLFPKVFAYDSQSDEQVEAAQVMMDLMEWAGNQSDYNKTALYATISALVNPASIIYTEYSETYREVKREKGANGYRIEKILDEDFSGFKDYVVPVDELFIENIYEHDIQKQAWLIWRKVISYEQAELKYGSIKEFEYVKPGVQLIFNDANTTFYEVYDANMRPEMVEEVIYWNKSKDLKITMVNGVMLCEADNPNPRNDKQYPFVKFGYELIDEGKFFYYKSLVFKMQQDEKIINTLYPMIIDGTYLNLFPPMVAIGSETIGSDVIVPGAVTTFGSPDSDLRPIRTSTALNEGLGALFQVEKSVSESSADYFASQVPGSKNDTAYGTSVIQNNANVILGLFVQMIAQQVKDFGKLRIQDVLQFLTIADASQITNAELVYKTFLLTDKAGSNVKKIKFETSLPEQADEETKLEESFKTLKMQGGLDSKTSLSRVNPELFRNLKFIAGINPDIMNPMSEELERQYGLQLYDRAIANPILDQEEVTKDFLLELYPKSKKDPSKYIKEQEMTPQVDTMGNPIDMMGKMTASGQPIPSLKLPTEQSIPKPKVANRQIM